ncbi:mechanosensitive ion channel domain-containing protein [Salinarimonas ramus]|uniref:Mechanosensitive ion channel protein MscS n=1 Tax=Salinarimonas ramus TaxID=690164 RepID=A0A917Q7R3_9HYPH|nr:mechanosensitive ion channel domain-containing protein [Salinarimonas ramus]GGK34794.1 mechanosensitive ion channel protein MscS [Salinarimonas ramus]
MRQHSSLIVFVRSHTRLAAVALLVSLALAILVLASAAAQAQIPGLSLPGAAAQEEAPPAEGEAPPEGEGAPAGEALPPELEALRAVIADDAARARLLQALEATAPDAAAAAALVAEAVEEEAPLPFATMIAEQTRGVAEEIAGLFAVTGRALETITALWGDVNRDDLEQLGRVLASLVLVVAVTIASYLALRWLAGRVTDRFARSRQTEHMVGRVVFSLATFLVEALTLAAAWAIGTFVVTNFGGTGRNAINQQLFINAFVMAEGIKLGVRAILRPRRGRLRIVQQISDTAAAYWYFWIGRTTSIVVYAFLFVAPIAAWNVSFTAGQAVRTLAILAACLVGILVTLQNREAVRRLMTRRAVNGNGNGKADATARFLAALGRVWHILAIVYFVALFVIWSTRPREALSYMLSATFESAIALAVGVGIAVFLSRFITGGMRLSDDVKQRLPLLESRLNAFVPKILHVIRLVVLIGILVAVAQAWELFDFLSWASSGVGLAVTTSLISAFLIVLVGIALYILVSSWVEYRLNPDYGTPPTARERTLLSLFRNAFTVTLVVVIAIMVLSELGVNVGPLLAGAGVVGLAVGFGAQKLVQDVITGVFIQLENAMNEGDVVSAGGISGVVERLTIRSVSIRDLHGAYHLVPFSSVDMVTNMMRHFAYYVADIGVAYRENVPEVKQAMQDAFDLLTQSEEHGANIIGPFELWGVEALADSAVVIRARIKTAPGKQWSTGRGYLEVVKQVFDERGIEIPFPHLTLYAGEGKTGTAPPLRILTERAPANAEPAPAPQLSTAKEAVESIAANTTAAPEETGAKAS